MTSEEAEDAAITHKRHISSSAGSSYDFSEVKRRNNKLSKRDDELASVAHLKKHLPVTENISFFHSLLLDHTCQKSSSGLNCIRTSFQEGFNFDDNTSSELLLNCRKTTFTMNKSESQNEMMRQFHQSIRDKKIVSSKEGETSLRYEMDYHLCRDSTNPVPVCRECFAFAYNFSVTDIKKYAELSKSQEDRRPVANLNAATMTDATIPSGTYNEIEDMFIRNLNYYKPG